MRIVEDAVFDTKFNHVKHTVELYLDGGNGESDNLIFPINPNSIVNLTIEDSLSDWPARGHMTFFYNPESGSGSMNYKLGQILDSTTNINTIAPKTFYNFRNDGNDKLRVRIVPTLSDSNTQSQIPGLTNISDPKHWTLSYLFSVYDIEDIGSPPGSQNAASNTIKCLKIYFWDEWYQKMITDIMEYSTAKSNVDQKLETGKAMKEIIEKSLEGLDSTDGVPVNDDEWEDGSSKIFYTTPTQTNAYESLMYIYDKHTSEKTLDSGGADKVYDFSLLIKERGPEATDIGRLTLKPVSTFFEKAGKDTEGPGEYQIEHFFLQAYGGNTDKTLSYRAPIIKGASDKIDFKSPKYGMITSYRFVDMSPTMNFEEFCTSPVYSFDFKNRIYRVEFQNNSVKTARKLIAEKYIKEVYTNSRGTSEDLFLTTLDKDKEENRNIKPVFSLYGDQEDAGLRQTSGLQKLLYVGLFQNACIHFKTLGLSFREPGRFIGIDKTEGVDSGDFQDKFYGQWFVINVRHVFESELYYNEITAVKLHRFDSLQNKFPGTF
jgi:hypothetical protein